AIELLFLGLNGIVELQHFVPGLGELRVRAEQIGFERDSVQYLLTSLTHQLFEDGDGRLQPGSRTLCLHDPVIQPANLIARRLPGGADPLGRRVHAHASQIDPEADPVLLSQRLRDGAVEDEAESRRALHPPPPSPAPTPPTIAAIP